VLLHYLVKVECSTNCIHSLFRQNNLQYWKLISVQDDKLTSTLFCLIYLSLSYLHSLLWVLLLIFDVSVIFCTFFIYSAFCCLPVCIGSGVFRISEGGAIPSDLPLLLPSPPFLPSPSLRSRTPWIQLEGLSAVSSPSGVSEIEFGAF